MSYTRMKGMRCIQVNDKIIALLKPDCTLAEMGHHKCTSKVDHRLYIKMNKNIYVGAPS